MSSFAMAVLVASTLVPIGPVLGADLPSYTNLIRSAAEDEVKHLPDYVGSAISFKHYSGYLAADEVKPTTTFLHYWLVESQSEPDEDPLVLWLNGGPGCSSLFGLLTELGPFKLNVKNDTLVENKFAWNQRANVLFLESPAGVGFSHVAGHGNIWADDDSTARQNLLSLRSFMKKFPKFSKRPLYLTGESYAGVYLPTLAVLLDKDPKFNLKGVAIGNGFMNEAMLRESRVFYSYFHGLIDGTKWANFSNICCNGKAPSLGQCGSCHHFDLDLPGNIDYYNILAENRGDYFGNRLNRFMRQKKMRQALHIPNNVAEFIKCLRGFYTKIYPHRLDGLAPQMRQLMESPRNLSLLSYNGDLDLVCDFIGVRRFVDELKRPIVSQSTAWTTDGQISGFVKKFDRITFLTVKGAGHMVPTDKPAEALNMFHMFIDGMFAPNSIWRNGPKSNS